MNRRKKILNACGSFIGSTKFTHNPCVDINSVTSTNAATYQLTPTYDGSNQVVNPDIYYNAGGWNGYKYWMIIHPYPNNDQTKENPSILVCDDGDTWAVPAGLTNPIEAAPPSGNYADGEIFLGYDGLLWVTFLHGVSGGSYKIYAKSSVDGVIWSVKTEILSGGYLKFISPVVIMKNGIYVMYYLDWSSSPGLLKRRTCSTVTGTWSDEQVCSLNGLSTGRYMWHINVNKYGNEYHMLLTTSSGLGGGESKLNFAISSNGINWTAKANPIIDKSASGWDNQLIYRACAVLNNNGSDYYDTWYSARSVAQVWHIGRTVINFSLV